MGESRTPPGVPARPDTSVAHNARGWGQWIGGEDTHEVDRWAGDQVVPAVRDIAAFSQELHPVEPGPVSCSRRRAGAEAAVAVPQQYGAVPVKP
ncbi:SAM-dependent methyltransferase [Streptomyces cathayae]|uniref:SAM-dependent methyltransferase n=1 Tax=Streptomyces cathayae TaxID=3031124 RepID=A0ABY8JV49_9ACTN|nr:SAM-dependent methyltransferase [Streptomyces sp. HUAS 5]WGD39309.1 SAM-dependent methyltransferase [Streptomyces sp. HUAS 5]